MNQVYPSGAELGSNRGDPRSIYSFRLGIFEDRRKFGFLYQTKGRQRLDLIDCKVVTKTLRSGSRRSKIEFGPYAFFTVSAILKAVASLPTNLNRCSS